MPFPSRDEEAVSRPPGQSFADALAAADGRNALPFDDMINRAARVPVTFGRFPGGKPLYPTADRRHRRAARDRIRVFEQDAVVRVPAVRRRDLFQCRERVGPFIRVRQGLAGDGRRTRTDHAEALTAVAVGLHDRLGRPLAVILMECRVQIRGQMNIEDVQPDDRIFAGIVVIVPGPVGREHEIPRLHQHLLAFDIRVRRSVAFDDEAERGGGMTMAFRALARLDKLDRHLKRPAGGFLFRQGGIHELHRPPLGGIVDAAKLDDLAGLHKTGIDRRPWPHMGLELRRAGARLPMSTERMLRHSTVQSFYPWIGRIDLVAHRRSPCPAILYGKALPSIKRLPYNEFKSKRIGSITLHNAYRLAAFFQSTSSRFSGATPRKQRAMVSRVFGQVDVAAGKFVDHRMCSAPMYGSNGAISSYHAFR